MHVHARAFERYLALVAILACDASVFVKRIFSENTSLEIPVHEPAVSPRELTGTAALMRGIPPGARGGEPILGMALDGPDVSEDDRDSIVFVHQQGGGCPRRPGCAGSTGVGYGGNRDSTVCRSWRKSLISLESSSDL